MAETRGETGEGEPRHVPYRAMRGAELVPTRAGVHGPWNECVFERVAREVDDASDMTTRSYYRAARTISVQLAGRNGVRSDYG